MDMTMVFVMVIATAISFGLRYARVDTVLKEDKYIKKGYSSVIVPSKVEENKIYVTIREVKDNEDFFHYVDPINGLTQYQFKPGVHRVVMAVAHMEKRGKTVKFTYFNQETLEIEVTANTKYEVIFKDSEYILKKI